MGAGEVLAVFMGADSVLVTGGAVAWFHRLVPPRAKPTPGPSSGPAMTSLPPAPPAVAPHPPGTPVTVLPAPQDVPGGGTAAVFGAALKTLREAHGLSARELARRAGLHHSTVASAEAGNANLTLNSAVQLARPFPDVTFDSLIGRSETREEAS